MAETGSEHSLGSLMRVLIPFVGPLPARPIYVLEAPPPNTITMGVRVSTYEFWGPRQLVHNSDMQKKTVCQVGLVMKKRTCAPHPFNRKAQVGR